MTRKLKISWSELDAAFQTGSWEMHFYLDLESGDVVMVTDEASRYLEESLDEELPDWMQEMVKVAQQVEEGCRTRYIQIPQADSHENYRDMEHFIGTVGNPHLQDRLWRAIQGRGAFRRFKDVLLNHPAERERWFAFKDRCVYERMMEWLKSEDIEPTNPMEPPEESEPEPDEQSSRDELIEDLTLLLIYLCSWEERLLPDATVRRAWKGYLFEVLDALEEQGYISQTRRAKSVTLTEAGLWRAQELEALYAV
jgi:hypothetical protein